MNHVTTKNSLEILSLRYGRSLLPLSVAAREIGINLRTAHNQISKGRFPVPTILQTRRRYVHVEDLAGYIDRLRRTSGTGNHLPMEVTQANGRTEKLAIQTSNA
ncbi:MAG: pyocin activator PrtN family protein [Candidatus Nitricoxidivorans perseverans]|uniref:Pyocin activator PrtN family protein n=1 Tax=Candidatus Nitricoxidivorans perseverans TaxID=2975601 RepID=A0AA49FM33_9PROT|nr:MAG: pyocin activator PrtN family protein [Candidatus Nitricoxidivorans perseverans]